jgi:hypothetical protein
MVNIPFLNTKGPEEAMLPAALKNKKAAGSSAGGFLLG